MSESGIIFRVETKKRNAFNMKTKHSHSHYEIYYLKSGERYYFIDDRIYHVNQGDIIFIPKNVFHRTTAANNDEHERTVVYFRSQLLNEIIPDLKKHPIMNCFYREAKVLRLKLLEQNTVEQLLNKLISEAKNPQPDSLLYQKAILIELLVFINRIQPTSDNTSLDSLNPIHEKIHNIVRYICDNYATKITLTQLSEDFFISQYYLSRMFKEVTGLTLIEYLNTIRIKESQILLRKTDYSITDIAGLVGYENQTYFGRIFKRISGMSPRDYRKSSSQL